MNDTATTTDCEAFIRRICEEPFEDTHRLVFADWLDENGGEGWAYLIRNQDRPIDCPLGFSADVSFYRKGIDGSCTVKLQEGKSGLEYTIDRGFVSAITAWSPHDFVANAKKLFADHPVTSVTLADRDPHRDGPRTFEWFTHPNITTPVSPPSAVPVEFRHFFTGHRIRNNRYASNRTARGVRRFAYPTEVAAVDALSRAAVDYGRWLAGLPRLYPTPVEGE